MSAILCVFDAILNGGDCSVDIRADFDRQLRDGRGLVVFLSVHSKRLRLTRVFTSDSGRAVTDARRHLRAMQATSRRELPRLAAAVRAREAAAE